MHTRGNFARLAVFVVMGSLVFSLTTRAAAESDAARTIRASAATVPTTSQAFIPTPIHPKDSIW